MQKINLFEEAKKLKKTDATGTTNLLTADQFSIEVRVHQPKHKPRLHTCSQDEFIYALEGVVDMLVDGQEFLLNEGESVLIPAGVRHKTMTREGSSWMLVSKEPHEHKNFERGDPIE